MSMSAISWKTGVGVNHVGAYQVSGRPFASGSINASTTTKVEFPKVTRWLYVANDSTDPCRIGFSQNGVEGTNFFSLAGNGATTDLLELKISEVWLSGSNNVSVMAGLTNIETTTLSSSIGPNWSGSAGVG
jgi:hypothetical protein